MSSESVSALRLADISPVGPLQCNRTSQGWAAGNRYSNGDRGSMCFKMLQASTAHKSKASSTSVSSTRSKTRLTSHWWGVRRQTLQQDGARHGVHGYVCGLHVAENLSSAIQIIRNDASVQELMNVITLEDISTVNFSASSNNALGLLLPRTHTVVRGGILQRVSNWQRSDMNLNTALELLLPLTHFMVRGSIPQRTH